MLGYWRTHVEYQDWLKSELVSLTVTHEANIRFYAPLIEKVYIFNLDPVKKVIAKLYSPLGRPAKNQPELLRALVVMLHCQIHDPTKFVDKLRASPVLRAICGFEKGETPGVGTFYDLLERLWLLDNPQKAIRKPKSKGRKRPKSGKKLPAKHPGIVKRLVDRALKGQVIEKRPESILQKILKECAVLPSSKLGLLGNPNKLAIAGDGAPLLTGATPYGKRICDCPSKGIYRCKCKRVFTDPDANWGWDSYHDQWFYGHTLYSITSADSKNDLPLYLRLVQGSRNDSVTFVVSWAELLHLYPDFKFSKALLDAAHDVYDIYRLLHANETEPFIDLNNRAKGNNTFPGPINVDENGVPICLEGLPMLNWGFSNDRCRIKWRCPHHKDSSKCSKKHECSPSAYGRVVYTKPIWDLRLFTPTPRNSKAWKHVYARRTTVERTFKRILVDYKIELANARTKKRWFWQATLAAINQHLDAQVAVVKPNILEKIGLETFSKSA
ncbi:transposase [Metallumcola ferriviriculae]|uniref:Transposase n=1 Tax=Metallumcola ferriviriculae TaxID=3039180 RepID=A0AAU0UQK6_9FIRM|nr:transposase [Desulfitibacteraceae bacterium MK1]WRO22660.1 transposase [Desulfitibacteraceae bacterium MK1]WRO23230.1 transposase [Desulfitibacteraceae bacterium MK1]